MADEKTAIDQKIDISSFKNLQRDINCLSDGTRFVRQKTLEKLWKELLLSTEDIPGALLDEVFKELCIPLLKLFHYPSDKCRELSVKLILGLCQKVPEPWQFLQYIIPVLVDRLGNKEIVEHTEELRYSQLEALGCLIALCKNHISMFVKDIIQILEMTIADPFPDVKKESCICTEKLAEASPEKFFQYGEALITPLLKSMSHQHQKVRTICLRTIGVVLKQTSGKEIDNVVSHIAQRTFDHAPPVRLMVTTVVGDWLLNLRDRYSFFNKLLPLLLTGLSDELTDIREKSRVLFVEVGHQYEMENEEELKEKRDIHIVKHFEAYIDTERPSIGCRSLIQRNFSKILPALLGDLKDWVIETRIKAIKLLYHLIFYAEDYITMHLEPLFQGLYKSVQDEEETVVNNTIKCAELIGLYVEPSIYCNLVLPQLQCASSSSTKACAGTLAILTALVKNANPSNINKELKSICTAVNSPDVCCTVTTDVHIQLMEFISQVISRSEFQLDDVSFLLFNTLLHVTALTRDQDVLNKANELYDALGKASNLNSTKDFVVENGSIVLKNMETSADTWTSNSAECFVLERLLLLNDESLPLLLDKAIVILINNMKVQKDPELRLKLFALTSKLALKAVDSVEIRSALQTHCITLLGSAVIPNCVWQPGRVAAAVRAASMSCLWSLFRGQVVQPNHLDHTFSDLITQILSCLDDDNQTTRIVTCKTLLRLFLECKTYFDAERLNVIYPELLKRMDDSLDEIRIITTKTFSAYFKCFLNYDVDLYRLHLEAIFKGLLVHLDDSDKQVQDAVLVALKDASNIHPNLLKSKINEVSHKHRLSRYCDELINYIDTLLVSKLELKDET